MQARILAQFTFDKLRATLDGKPHQLFGSVSIEIDAVTWSVRSFRIDQVPGRPALKISPGSALHGTVEHALVTQFGDEIDEFATDKIENQGGYELLFGHRMPVDPAWRGVPRRPAAMSRTFYL